MEAGDEPMVMPVSDSSLAGCPIAAPSSPSALSKELGRRGPALAEAILRALLRLDSPACIVTPQPLPNQGTFWRDGGALSPFR